jgi:hypothetical protein
MCVLSIPRKWGHLVSGDFHIYIYIFMLTQPLALWIARGSQTTDHPHFWPHPIPSTRVDLSSAVSGIKRHRPHPRKLSSVGTLENGYVLNVPLPRIPRRQSTSRVADTTNWYMRVDTYKFVCNESIIRIRIYDLVSPRVSSHPSPNKTGASASTSRESHVTCYSWITWIPTWSELSLSPEGLGTIPIVPFSPLVG